MFDPASFVLSIRLWLSAMMRNGGVWTSVVFEGQKDKPQSGSRDRTGGDEFLFAGVDNEIQPFESARAQKQQVPFFRKDDLINGECFANPDDCEADTSCDLLAVGHDK